MIQKVICHFEKYPAHYYDSEYIWKYDNKYTDAYTIVTNPSVKIYLF